MKNYYPINVNGMIFYGYFDNDEYPTEYAIKSISNLEVEDYMSMGEDCFHAWESQIGDLNREEDYCLYLGILVPTIERTSVEQLIEVYSIHDIEIIFSKKLYIYNRKDDFDNTREYIGIEEDKDTISSYEYILLRLNPNEALSLRSRHIVSYMLGVIFRMLSALEGHIYEYFQKIGDNSKYSDYSSSILGLISEVNNFYVDEGESREQIICGMYPINENILLKFNDISLMNELFGDYSLSNKPSQTPTILRIKGE